MRRFNLVGPMIAIITLLWMGSIPCLMASWDYSTGIKIDTSQDLTIEYFPWQGSGDVSDEGEAGETTQLAGMETIIAALNNEGLSTDSKLNQYIDKRIKNFNKLEYGSVDVKEDAFALLSDITTMNPNLQFILQGKVAGSGKNKYVEYFYLYLISNTDYDNTMAKWAQSGLSESDYQADPTIFPEYFYPVTRILIEKNDYDQWAPSVAQIGYAGFGYYEGSNNGGGQKVWTMYTSSWTPDSTAVPLMLPRRPIEEVDEETEESTDDTTLEENEDILSDDDPSKEDEPESPDLTESPTNPETPTETPSEPSSGQSNEENTDDLTGNPSGATPETPMDNEESPPSIENSNDSEQENTSIEESSPPPTEAPIPDAEDNKNADEPATEETSDEAVISLLPEEAANAPPDDELIDETVTESAQEETGVEEKEKASEPTYYCNKEEHEHGDECDKATCEIEEHKHDDSCLVLAPIIEIALQEEPESETGPAEANQPEEEQSSEEPPISTSSDQLPEELSPPNEEENITSEIAEPIPPPLLPEIAEEIQSDVSPPDDSF